MHPPNKTKQQQNTTQHNTKQQPPNIVLTSSSWSVWWCQTRLNRFCQTKHLKMRAWQMLWSTEYGCPSVSNLTLCQFLAHWISYITLDINLLFSSLSSLLQNIINNAQDYKHVRTRGLQMGQTEKFESKTFLSSLHMSAWVPVNDRALG